MQIFYDIIDPNTGAGKYLIRDLGIGFGAFARLDHPLELKDNHLLNLGESFIIANLVEDNIDKNKQQYSLHSGSFEEKTHSINNIKLRLKIFGGPSTGEIFYF